MVAESKVDSRHAAKGIARLLLIAVLIGLLAGAATFAFLAVDHHGINFLTEDLPAMLPGISPTIVSVGVVAAMTLLCALVVSVSGGRPFDMGMAEAEYDNEGRMDYRRLPAGIVFSLASLFSGAAVGPEAPLTDISGGIGTWVADRLRLEPGHVKIMAYAGVAGAFGAFFGAAPVGALLAAELISPKSMNLSRLDLATGLAAGSVGYVTFIALGGEQISSMMNFPAFAEPRIADMALAVAVGAVGGLVGLIYGLGMLKTRVATQSLRSKPWLAALAGGVPLAAAAAFAPYLMFSGQAETPKVIANAATLGILVLLGLGLGKLALSVWSLSTAFFGGPIFPMIFAGTCFGLALNLAVPGIPQGVAVMAFVSGMAVSAMVAPLSVTIFLSLIADPSLAPVIALAAVASFVIRQAVAPTIPGVHRATHAAETDGTGHAR